MSTRFSAGTIDRSMLEQLYESTVISRDGVRIGTVIDLVRRNGEIVSLVISGGGLFGVGAGQQRIPVAAIVEIDGLDVHLVLHSRQLV
ncbi:MAG TPA: PRC-barrel domain-containing protein [Thermomicrobiales bacterium]|nr:PRC-barrel domain-containing protein [Thermomicrobiales bacterium]